ncbi:site-specific DNA-methyltransferase [bacterium]|nr:site-specific DNA-methyltransferase [candidate division CSSED10-310 bacterium]
MDTAATHFERRTKTGQSIRLFREDCIAGMNTRLDPGSVDVVVTSPPYNLGIRYGRYDDTTPRDQYLRWMNDWAQAVKRILSEQGSIFLNMGSKPSDPWVPFEVAAVMRNHFTLQNVIHWIKSIYIKQSSYGSPLEINVGHYKPINSPRYVNDMHEYIFHLTRTGTVKLDRTAIGVPYKDQTNISRWHDASGGVRCRGNVWYIPYETIQDHSKDRPHPAAYPPELAGMCIRLHGMDRVNLVLDPFSGLGNTALACMELGVDFIGFEIDETYFEESRNRIRQAVQILL